MKGGGLYVSTPNIADTQGIAFGLGTQLDIGSLSVYSRGRAADGTIDTGDALRVSGIHLADANTGGAWMLADLDKHPGLINAMTDANGSYLHLQIGWPTAADGVAAASLRIDNISFTTAGVNGARADRDQPRRRQHRVAADQLPRHQVQDGPMSAPRAAAPSTSCPP